MPVAAKLKPASVPRPVLKPGGNRVTHVSEDTKSRNLKKKPQRTVIKKEQVVAQIGDESVVVLRSNNVSCVDSTYSSDSDVSVAKKVNSRRSVKRNGIKAARVTPDAAEVATLCVTPKVEGPPLPPKRCDWITPRSDPLYTTFHDEEWGVPVDDDRKLFELLVFSQALAEHTWPAILNQRDIFRKLFENFDPSSIALFSEKKLLTPKINGNSLLSEPKFRAIVENAKQILKVQQEFGSFSKYCWRFVNHKPIRNEFRYGRQVPVKTPKAELISKDMMRRGFQCVGPTVVYSFMQVAGLVNDHLLTCFRYQECNVTTKNEFKTEVKEKKVHNEGIGSMTEGV